MYNGKGNTPHSVTNNESLRIAGRVDPGVRDGYGLKTPRKIPNEISRNHIPATTLMQPTKYDKGFDEVSFFLFLNPEMFGAPQKSLRYRNAW